MSKPSVCCGEKTCLTQVVIEGELVVVPDLDRELWSHFGFRFIQTPEMFLCKFQTVNHTLNLKIKIIVIHWFGGRW